ncbi:hypothetical protein [Burkholderia ubonensis]|uniref:hypothetical protein n=1 Tax=Burkholderia ubonensis TaxID=101571 RepID=UPI000F58B306|nr:hypothetical protein [Burkholderia ubonensis]
MPLFSPSFKRHFANHQWNQDNVLKETHVDEAQDGMCLALTLHWLTYMKTQNAPAEDSFYRLISDRPLLKQLAGQQRHYGTNPLSTLPKERRGPVSPTHLVELSSTHSSTLGRKCTLGPARLADEIAREIDQGGYPVFFEVGIFFKVGFRAKEPAGHSIGIAVDAYDTLALFDPNYGLAIIERSFSGIVKRNGKFDEVVKELISLYEADEVTYNRVIDHL